MSKLSSRAIVHRSAKGQIVDMDKLRNMNGDLKALGNANLNARGDVLDSKGRIVKRRDQIVQEYYARNPDGVKYVSMTNPTQFATPESLSDMQFETPQQIKARKEQELQARNNKEPKLDTPTNVAGKKAAKKLIDDKE